MARDYREYTPSVFKPLVEAAGNPGLLDKLCVRPPAEEVRKDQFKRFHDLKINDGEVFPFPDGGFIALGAEHQFRRVFLCTDSLNSDDKNVLLELALEELDLTRLECDDATFFILCHELSEFMALRVGYRGKESALQQIDIVDEEYDGHELGELQKVYKEIHVFEHDENNALFDCGVETYALRFLRKLGSLRSPIIDRQFSEVIFALEGRTGCHDESLLQSITASQWRHAFLEIYRCLEAVLYFPWVLEFKNQTQIATSVEAIRDRSRHDMGWFWKERESFVALMELLDCDELTELEPELDIFNDIDINAGAKRGAYGNRIYSIRNRLVHANERNSEYLAELTNKRIREAALYVATCLKCFDEKFHQHFPRP